MFQIIIFLKIRSKMCFRFQIFVVTLLTNGSLRTFPSRSHYEDHANDYCLSLSRSSIFRLIRRWTGTVSSRNLIVCNHLLLHPARNFSLSSSEQLILGDPSNASLAVFYASQMNDVSASSAQGDRRRVERE